MIDNSISERLTTCFLAVFPKLPEAEVSSASVDTVVAWDSLAAITLLHVVEEEFQIEIDLEKLVELDSFARWAEFLSAAPR